jgi:hypothetical protein
MMNKRWKYLLIASHSVLLMVIITFVLNNKRNFIPVAWRLHEFDDHRFEHILHVTDLLHQQDWKSVQEIVMELQANQEDDVAHFVERQLSFFMEKDSISDRMAQENYELLLKLGELNNQLKSTKKVVSSANKANDSLEVTLSIIAADLEKKEEKLSELNKNIDSLSSSTGKLSFKNEMGKEVSYYGKVLNGKANGYGVGIYDNKGIYQGEWRNNVRHGRGKYIWNNGDQYIGEYAEGKREGAGNYYFVSGERYEGGWKSDVRNGYGIFYAKDGSILLKGEWENDKCVKKEVTKEVTPK